MQFFDAGNGREHSEHAVVLSGVSDGVQVRADDKRRQTVAVFFVAPDQISDCIGSRYHSRLVHPRSNKFAGALLLGGEKQTRQLARLRSDGGEFFNAQTDVWAHRHRLHFRFLC